MKRITFLSLITVLTLFISSCKKETPTVVQPASSGKTPYYLRMTDAPGPYTAVNVDIREVVITGNGGSDITLNTNAGIYNLLNFSNGVDTLIAWGNINLSKVEQIRLILGPNNSVVVNGNTYALDVPSGEQSGLKLQVHHTLQAGVAYNVLLDFDARHSIVETGNGSYKLKPVIRTIETALSGSIKGHINPSVLAWVTVTSGGMSYTTVTDAHGNFIISGLPAGTYSLEVDPVAPYNTVTLNNVQVAVGQSTDVGLLVIN